MKGHLARSMMVLAALMLGVCFQYKSTWVCWIIFPRSPIKGKIWRKYQDREIKRLWQFIQYYWFRLESGPKKEDRSVAKL